MHFLTSTARLLPMDTKQDQDSFSSTSDRKAALEKDKIKEEVTKRLKFAIQLLPQNERTFEEAYEQGVKEAVTEMVKNEAKSVAVEASTELVKEETKDKKKFSELLKNTQQVLFRAASVFPFEFFPDEIMIDVGKVSIVERIFFFSECFHSIAINSIKDIAIETSILFATLNIVPDGYPNNPLTIKYLKKGDAIKARKIIQGLLIASKENVDPGVLAIHNLPKKIEEIGGINEIE